MKWNFLSAIITILLSTGIINLINARHIIGGVITYECKGNDKYEFTMRIYRDCNCTDCAPFDNFASIGIYRCGNGTNCATLRQGATFQSLSVPIQQITPIEAPDYPCLIPPNVCVQEGLYTFEATLPKSDESYFISYQRCCRNITISNITEPQNSGATYSIEITPEAQFLCNSSPKFRSFPPTVVCADAPLEFDHSAEDNDGDQLIYSFCTPFLGGGNIVQGPSINSCDGAQPLPACPPPYNNVTFVAPTYSASKPMGGDPLVTIDPNTGLITGTPDRLGQFVVGVCVEEYRGDTLLSRVFRDFQFNVASCDPTVVASIEADEIIDGQEFVVNACGEVDVTINNQSFQRQFVDIIEWNFDIRGDNAVSRDWSPTFTFPGLGQYKGILILNPDTECGDTADVVVNVLPDITADFTFEYDTCRAGPVQFEDLSETGGEFLAKWEWDFGDGINATDQDPRHTYELPGLMPVNLKVTDSNNCSDEITKEIPYYPIPELLIASPNNFEGCAPGEIFFNNLSSPIDSSYDITWEFGDGGIGKEFSPIYIYEDEGVYTVTLEVVSPIGCRTDTIFPDLVTIRASPTADFTFSPEEPSNLSPTVFFSDQSKGASHWQWEFGMSQTSNERNPTITFQDTGRVEVRQIVTHISGCKDTLSKVIDVKPEVRYFLPNAFTPNGDSVNDTFKGVGLLEGATNFEMTIWNRWGELIFQTDNPDEAWNGRKNNQDAESQSGVYVVVVKFIGPRGNRFNIKGFATLIR